jgi:hypothetical protein
MTSIFSRGRQVSDRHLLIGIAVVALCMWAGLLLFTYFVKPAGIAAITGAFLLLGLALTGTGTLVIYFISWAVLVRRGRRPHILQSLREGGLTSLWLIFNLLLSSLHSWSIFITVISFAIIVIIELLVLGRA